jgi:hypothetical protein
LEPKSRCSEDIDRQCAEPKRQEFTVFPHIVGSKLENETGDTTRRPQGIPSLYARIARIFSGWFNS